MADSSPTAAIVVIGNEILSGRTQDTNTHWLAGRLTELGIRLREVRVVPDVEGIIISTIRECMRQFTYVFTTGGIGPTHDDITANAIATLFNVSLECNEDAKCRLEAHYQAELNEARLKMAYIPDGAKLIDNPVSAAPGFIIENVYVMAGVPSIMRAMFNGIAHTLQGGEPLLSRTLTASTTEGVIAAALTKLQHKYTDVDMGSYPFIRAGKLGVSIVLRSTDAKRLDAATTEVHDMLANCGEVSETPT